MDTFNQAKNDNAESVDCVSIIEKYNSGALDEESFLKALGKADVFYSTPYGDHKDGGSRAFLLPAQGNTAYHPVFTSAERATELYTQVGRVGFMLVKCSFMSFVETAREVNKGSAPIKLGTVIDPGHYGISIEANMLDKAIELMKRGEK